MYKPGQQQRLQSKWQRDNNYRSSQHFDSQHPQSRQYQPYNTTRPQQNRHVHYQYHTSDRNCQNYNSISYRNPSKYNNYSTSVTNQEQSNTGLKYVRQSYDQNNPPNHSTMSIRSFPPSYHNEIQLDTKFEPPNSICLPDMSLPPPVLPLMNVRDRDFTIGKKCAPQAQCAVSRFVPTEFPQNKTNINQTLQNSQNSNQPKPIGKTIKTGKKVHKPTVPMSAKELEELEKWKADRRKNYPTPENMSRKKALAEEKFKRGDVLKNDVFKKFKDRKKNTKVYEKSDKEKFERKKVDENVNGETSTVKQNESNSQPKAEEQKENHKNVSKNKKSERKLRPPNRSSLLERLLASDIRHERNIVLQCVRYCVRNNFFIEEESTDL